MRIAITGSSRLAAEFTNADYYRIDDDIDFDQYDVFINHAHREFDQVYLLEKVVKKWFDDPTKLIINISSRASQPNISKGFMYASQKAALDHYADNLTYNSSKKCRITTLNLGLLASDLPSCTFSEVYDMICYIMNLPQHLEIQRLYMQHSENYQSVQQRKENV